LQFCKEHHKRTCCERNHTRQVLNTFTAFSHERSPSCTQMSRLALCSKCDADVGIGRLIEENLVALCPSFCARWYNACIEDFFAPPGSGHGLQPCGPGALVCSPLKEIAEDPKAFCQAVPGFAMGAEEDEPDNCFDGIPAAKTRGKGPRAPWVKPSPPRDPWYRRFWPSGYRHLMNSQLYHQAQGYMPGAIIACVVGLFSWFVFKGD